MIYTDLPLLSFLILTPLLGAGFILLARSDTTCTANIKTISLLTTAFTFLISVALLVMGDYDKEGFSFVDTASWIPALGITYTVGLDGVSSLFVVLTSLLTFLALAMSLPTQHYRVKEYCLAFLVLESFILGAFSAMDIFLFYLFFEGVLIPMFFIIGIWGGPRRAYAVWKFFLCTFMGSLLLLVALVYLYDQFGTSSLPKLVNQSVPLEAQRWLWLAFFASFAIKLPIYPFHTWLPDAHVEAPTAGSVLLAGVLLKLGGYGFFRLSLPLLPDACQYFSTLIFVLSALAVVNASWIAYVQKDMKKMVAYASIAHMGFVTAGLFMFSSYGIQGALVQMLSHGLISGGLFMVIGVLYNQTHTRDINAFGGVASALPVFAFLSMILLLGNLALPGTSGFVGEILVIMGAFQINAWMAAFLGLGMVMGAIYGLKLYGKVMFGPISATTKLLRPTTWHERAVLGTLASLVVAMGIWPQPIIEHMSSSIQPVLEKTQNLTMLTVMSDTEDDDPETDFPDEPEESTDSEQQIALAMSNQVDTPA